MIITHNGTNLTITNSTIINGLEAGTYTAVDVTINGVTVAITAVDLTGTSPNAYYEIPLATYSITNDDYYLVNIVPTAPVSSLEEEGYFLYDDGNTYLCLVFDSTKSCPNTLIYSMYEAFKAPCDFCSATDQLALWTQFLSDLTNDCTTILTYTQNNLDNDCGCN